MPKLHSPLSFRFHDALAYASELHASQSRKELEPPLRPPTPYISHLLAACAIVLEAGGTEDEAIAAVERANAAMIAAACIVGIAILLAAYHPQGWQPAIAWSFWVAIVIAASIVFRTALATFRNRK
ncbi:MAG: hypothetical protein M3Y21_06550 [Candidatus Eremiobacteraeota bacterium]|nr:hypothetical protein [Candidatus Eremiobacteraeota bacterium]